MANCLPASMCVCECVCLCVCVCVCVCVTGSSGPQRGPASRAAEDSRASSQCGCWPDVWASLLLPEGCKQGQERASPERRLSSTLYREGGQAQPLDKSPGPGPKTRMVARGREDTENRPSQQRPRWSAAVLASHTAAAGKLRLRGHQHPPTTDGTQHMQQPARRVPVQRETEVQAGM